MLLVGDVSDAIKVKLDEVVRARKASDVCGQNTINASIHVRSPGQLPPQFAGRELGALD